MRIIFSAGLVVATLLTVACAPPRPSAEYYARERGENLDDTAATDEETAPAAITKGDGGGGAATTTHAKINKPPCAIPTAVEDKSGNVTCKTGPGLAPARVGGAPLDGTYVLKECAYYDGAVEKAFAKGTIRVTGEIMEYIDEYGYIGGAFRVEGTSLNLYGDACKAPDAATPATPTLKFGFSIDGADIVRVRDEPGAAVRVLRFTRSNG